MNRRSALLVYLLTVSVALIVIAQRFTRVATSWTLGDWLINYRGGFVRRGLMGEAALRVGNSFGISPVAVVAAIGILMYAVIFYSIWSLLRSSSWKWWVIAMLVSPATIAFPIMTARSGFHKEILYFAGLGVLLLMLRRGSAIFATSLFLCFVSVVTILSHEPVAAYAPYYLAALLIVYPPVRALKIIVIPVVVSAFALYATVQHPGTAETAKAICASLNNPNLCEGAVSYIGLSKASARIEVIDTARDFYYYRNYPIMLLLAALPIVGAYVALWSKCRRELVIIAVTCAVSSIVSIQLFLYGTDWGRWIYIHVFSLFLLLLFVDSRGDHGEEEPLSLPWFLLPYAMCWSMPGYGDNGLFGYISLVARGC